MVSSSREIDEEREKRISMEIKLEEHLKSENNILITGRPTNELTRVLYVRFLQGNKKICLKGWKVAILF